MLVGLALVPLPRFFDSRSRQWGLLAVLLVVLLLSDRADGVLRDPERPFALLLVVLAVLVPAALLLARGRGASRGIVAGGFAALALAVVAIGYPVQRHYLDERFRNEVAAESIPGMDLDSAYRWARGRRGRPHRPRRHHRRLRPVRLLRHRPLQPRSSTSAKRARTAPSTRSRPARAFRAAVNAADLDYLVTAPFLNFLHPGDPIPSPEARWLRGEAAVAPVLRSGPVTVWKVRGELDPAACGPRNAPLREIPDTPRLSRRAGWVISAAMSYPLENALFQWEEGYRELQALERPAGPPPRRPPGRRDPRRAAAADRRHLHRRRAGRPLRRAAPTGACRSRSTWRRRPRATRSRWPTRPSGSTCAAPATSPAADS